MRFFMSVFLLFYFFTIVSFGFAFACDPKTKLGLSRTIEIDTTGGALYGTVQYKKTLNLKPGEVVLTFDDGPHPQNTVSVLKTLKDHCTKATFFAVGQMIRTYPEVLKRVSEEGHTIAGHSHTHPNLQYVSLTSAKYEIERSFAEAIKATGKPVAPFFRFPGLGHSKSLNKYLASRNIATLSVDIVSNDSYTNSPSRIIRNVMGQLSRKKSGIILLHDLKKVTALALPGLLRELKKKGYKVVHIVPKKTMRKANYTIRATPEKKISSYKKRQKPAKKKRPRSNNRKVIRVKHDASEKPKTAPANKAPLACLFLLFACVR